jgi:hypothetical protein
LTMITSPGYIHSALNHRLKDKPFAELLLMMVKSR